MKATIEEYNEEVQWDIRESTLLVDGHIKIATATAAFIDWDGTIKNTQEVLIGIFGATDRLDYFSVGQLDTEERIDGEAIAGNFGWLHQGPLAQP